MSRTRRSFSFRFPSGHDLKRLRLSRASEFLLGECQRFDYNPGSLEGLVRNWMVVTLAVFGTAMSGFGHSGRNVGRAKQAPQSAWTPPPGQVTLNLWPHG